jgi:hypothetical protein
LLALDQVLRKPWSDLNHFWTSTHCSKKERLGGVEITDLTHFYWLCGPGKGSSRVFVMGLWDVDPWGLPMIRPYCKGL